MARKRFLTPLFPPGYAFGSLLRHLEESETPDLQERRRILARFKADLVKLDRAMMEFVAGEAGHAYPHEGLSVHQVVRQMQRLSMADLCADSIQWTLSEAQQSIANMILTVPIPVTSTVFSAESPFAAHRFLMNICAAATNELVWIDRYFDHTLFHRYLAEVPQGIPITLVTWPDSKSTNNKDRIRIAQFLGVSRLFSAERGPNGYRLLNEENIHARLLRVDDTMLQLGDSIKDLGNGSRFPVSKLDTTSDNRKQFDEPLASGIEVFGPSQISHP